MKGGPCTNITVPTISCQLNHRQGWVQPKKQCAYTHGSKRRWSVSSRKKLPGETPSSRVVNIRLPFKMNLAAVYATMDSYQRAFSSALLLVAKVVVEAQEAPLPPVRPISESPDVRFNNGVLNILQVKYFRSSIPGQDICG